METGVSFKIIQELERKFRLLTRRKEITEQLAGDPREPFYSALQKERVKIERELIRADEAFLNSYSKYRSGLKLNDKGEIDVSALRSEDRVLLTRIRTLIKAISLIH